MRVLLILGHPRKDSFGAALFDAYREGAELAGAEVRTLVVADMDFDPDVHVPSPEQQTYEPDIHRARECIDWAEHLVFVYPTWWGSVPARLKGLLDRVVTPGFAFHFRHPDKLAWDRLWKGKTSQAITTMDTPPWLYRWYYRQPGTRALLRATLGFCGVHARRGLMLGPVRLSDAAQRRAWLIRAHRAGLAVHGGRLRRWSSRIMPWLRALRLQFYPMSWGAYTMGALAQAGTAAFSSAAYWWGYVCLFALEAATVFGNDYFDYHSDRRNRAAGPFNGGSRVLVDRHLSFAQLRHGMAVALAMALVAAVLAVQTGPRPGAVGALLLVVFPCTLGYTLPPLKLSHRGLGELDVAVSHSFMVLLLGHLLQGGSWNAPAPWLLALPLSLAVLPAIMLSGLPDRHADAAANKHTLPVKLGAPTATRLAATLVVMSALATLVLSHAAPTQVAMHGMVWGVMPHAAWLTWVLWRRLREPDTLADRRIDGLMVLALSYILWFVVVPLCNLW